MKHFTLTTLAVLFLTATTSAQFDFGRGGQDGGRHIGGPLLGESQTQIWRTGVIVEPGAAMENVLVTIPVPMEWHEQRIISVNEERMDAHLASQIVYRYLNSGSFIRQPSDGAKVMQLQLRSLIPARPVEIVVAFELQNFELLPPENTDHYVIPARNRVPQQYRQYLQPSPTIESNNQVFRRMFEEITRDRRTDWEKVEALYSFVQNNVRYDDQARHRQARGALAITRMPRGEWSADCKDMSNLFVALCRAGGIPARIVRVPDHCYAEFFLEMRQEGQPRNAPPVGFWFPCQVAGTYSFGGIPERRVILQKGDSFPDPDIPGRRTLFLRQVFEGSLVPGSPPPRPRWVQETVVR